ncbi:hypothetical protein TNCT_270781 [Trichonephila clavata]|uniref:TAZ-type domain-containing protein n=1 Tax=Trichonephila clavata TaxID=2740835 RepID=A0A8X6J5B0_TRICU|nr:hypothetical protein TNCT_270781 [Trichonephila clavata]
MFPLPADLVERCVSISDGVKRDLSDPIYLLEHASRCDDLNCNHPMCITLKASFKHFRDCLDFCSCEKCERFFDLAFLHASICESETCLTFLCERIAEVRYNMVICKGESKKEAVAGPSSSKLISEYLNLDEKLCFYLKKRNLI